jgi:hypothetical protein
VSLGKANGNKSLMTHRNSNQLLSKPRVRYSPGIKLGGCLICWPSGNRCLDGAIPMAGSCVERGNLRHDAKGDPEDGRPVEGRVPMQGAGADGFAVVMKPGNAGGAKGPDLLAKDEGQPEMGGADV